jgi:transcriptional antiterminator RfaH
MLRWYLIQSKPNAEENARVNLERQGYEVYFPRLLQTARHAGHWRERITALFPRYLFVRLETGQQSLGPVRSTVGVANAVRFGSRYAIVPDEVVLELREQADPETGLHRLSRRAALLRGSPVRVTAGPFDGLEGLFEREAGSERVIVLLRLLGQDAPVRIPCDFVVPAHAT